MLADGGTGAWVERVQDADLEAHPAANYGFMYQRQLTDPDGNILEFGYMDPVAPEQGPKALNQQA